MTSKVRDIQYYMRQNLKYKLLKTDRLRVVYSYIAWPYKTVQYYFEI